MIIFSNLVKMVPNMLIHAGIAVTPLAARITPAIAPMTRPIRILYSTLKFRYARKIPPFLGALFSIILLLFFSHSIVNAAPIERLLYIITYSNRF